jgi:hypothetical protein
LATRGKEGVVQQPCYRDFTLTRDLLSGIGFRCQLGIVLLIEPFVLLVAVEPGMNNRRFGGQLRDQF